MNIDDFQEMRRALEGVTPGKWSRVEASGVTEIRSPYGLVCRIHWHEDRAASAHRDANFIETFDPTFIRELLDTAEKMKKSEDYAIRWANRSVGDVKQQDDVIIKGLINALEWYQEQAEATSRYMAKANGDALEAIMVSMSLDGGNRAKNAIKEATP